MDTQLTGTQAFMLNQLMDSEISRLSILLRKTEGEWHRNVITSNIDLMLETKKVVYPIAEAWLKSNGVVA